MNKKSSHRSVCLACNADLNQNTLFCEVCGRLRWSFFGIYIKKWELFFVFFIMFFIIGGVSLSVRENETASVYSTRTSLPPTRVPSVTPSVISATPTQKVMPTKTEKAATAVPTVIPTSANYAIISSEVYFANLRRSPGYVDKDDKQDSIVEIPRGSKVTILDGPKKADGLSWWHIQWNGYKGWVAESTGSGKTILIFDP